MQFFTAILGWCSIWIVLLPCIVGAIYLSRITVFSFLIWLNSSFAAVPQLVRYFHPLDEKRMLFYNCYSIAEFILNSLFFLLILKSNSILRKVLVFFGTIYAASFISSFFNRDIRVDFFNECVLITNIFDVAAVLLILYFSVA
jgi:hypothetical protein